MEAAGVPEAGHHDTTFLLVTEASVLAVCVFLQQGCGAGLCQAD